MENIASEEIVANDEICDKKTNNTNNQMEDKQEETNGLTGIRNIKALFEKRTADEIKQETPQKENKFKAGIESMNTKIASTSSSSLSSSSLLSSSAFDNSMPSNKKTSAVNNVHKNPPTTFLASSLTMTKSHNMENNASKEKVTNNAMCEENKRSKNTTNRLKNQMEGKQEQTNKLTGIKNIKAMFENKTTDEDKEETVHKENKFNTSEYNSNTNNAMNNKPLDQESSLPDLLDSSDLQVSQFLSNVSQLSAEKEKKTGNGKLDMTELAAALSSVTENGDQLDDKGLENNVVNNISSSRNNYKCNPQNQRNDQTLVSSSSSSSSSSLSQENKKSIKTEDEQQIKKTQSSFCHSTTLTTSSTKTQFSTKKSSFDSTPSNLDNAKTSFLQSIISQSPTANNEQSRGNLPTNGSKDIKHSLAFIPEKNSVMSELKNIINDEPTPIPNPPKRSFNSTPKGFQATTLSGQNLREGSPSQISSNDPMVKKIVYNQYREMLKSYTNCN